jgi:predicted phosphodiesterase
MRIFALSDLHVDFGENLGQVQSLSGSEHQQDALLVAGDAAHHLDLCEAALATLRQRFSRVFFIPGNHDLWVHDGEEPVPDLPVPGMLETSLERLTALEDLCARIGVETVPAAVGEFWVVPLYSWYEASFSERLHAEAPAARLRQWADYKRCRWSTDLADDESLCRYFAGLNDERQEARPERTVITFSHFLPRPELLPKVAHLRFKGLPRVAGTEHLERQLRAAGASVHVFGHTHIPWDETIDGVRYVQNPLAYPHERKRRGQDAIRMVQVG